MENAEKIFNDNFNLIHTILQEKFNLKPQNQDYEDYVQSASIGLWKACTSDFDDSKSKLSTYLCNCIFNEVSLIFRDADRKKRKCPNDIIELDAQIPGDFEGNTIATLIPDNSSVTELHSKITSDDIRLAIESSNINHKDILIDKLFNDLTRQELSIKYNKPLYTINYICNEGIKEIKMLPAIKSIGDNLGL